MAPQRVHVPGVPSIGGRGLGLGGMAVSDAFVRQSLGGELPALIARTANIIDDSANGGYSGNASAGGFAAYGYTAHKLPAGVDGYVDFQVPSDVAANAMIALSFSAALQTYPNSDYAAYVSSTSGAIQRRNKASSANTSVVPGYAATSRVRIERRGTSVLLRVSESGGNLWRTIATYSGAATDALYAHVYLSANKTLFDLKAASRPFVTNASIIVDSNSLTAGAYVTGAANYGGWPEMLGDKARYSGATIKNFAVSGQTLTQMLSDASTQVDTAAIDGVRNILLVWELRNEIFYNGSVSDAVAKYWQYIDARRATGKFYKIVAMGTLPSDITNFGGTPAATTSAGDDGPTFAGKVDDANAVIAADWATHADAYIDLRQASDLMPWSSDVSWDGTHLFAHGYATVRDLVDAAISGWL